MTLVLDAGALLAIEAGNREIMALLKRERADGRVPVTHGGVVGQVWRGGRVRQAQLSRLLKASIVQPLDEALGRQAGAVLAIAKLVDVIDAAVVLLAVDGDQILTSDPGDLSVLAEAAGLDVELVPV